MGAGPGDLRLRSQPHRLRLRARARDHDRLGRVQPPQTRLPHPPPPSHPLPPPYAAGDFAGWFEAYIGGRWYPFDARNNIPRIGRVLIAQGRDAADVPITQTFGPNTLVSFKVWTDEIV